MSTFDSYKASERKDDALSHASRAGTELKEAGAAVYDAAAWKAADISNKTADLAASSWQAAKDTGAAASQKAGELASAAKDNIKDTASWTADKAGEAWESTKAGASDAIDRMTAAPVYSSDLPSSTVSSNFSSDFSSGFSSDFSAGFGGAAPAAAPLPPRPPVLRARAAQPAVRLRSQGTFAQQIADRASKIDHYAATKQWDAAAGDQLVSGSVTSHAGAAASELKAAAGAAYDAAAFKAQDLSAAAKETAAAAADKTKTAACIAAERIQKAGAALSGAFDEPRAAALPAYVPPPPTYASVEAQIYKDDAKGHASAAASEVTAAASAAYDAAAQKALEAADKTKAVAADVSSKATSAAYQAANAVVDTASAAAEKTKTAAQIAAEKASAAASEAGHRAYVAGEALIGTFDAPRAHIEKPYAESLAAKEAKITAEALQVAGSAATAAVVQGAYEAAAAIKEAGVEVIHGLSEAAETIQDRVYRAGEAILGYEDAAKAPAPAPLAPLPPTMSESAQLARGEIRPSM